jgi:hypothetical protein
MMGDRSTVSKKIEPPDFSESKDDVTEVEDNPGTSEPIEILEEILEIDYQPLGLELLGHTESNKPAKEPKKKELQESKEIQK